MRSERSTDLGPGTRSVEGFLQSGSETERGYRLWMGTGEGRYARVGIDKGEFMAEQLVQTDGAKMMFLIKRKSTASREELIAHWFANHMPEVIARQEEAAEAGRLHARRYIATVFDERDGDQAWDGVAQLWFDQPIPMPAEPHGTTPADSFQERANPYVPWATTEYVALDGSDRIPVRPLTLNDPFPTTRSGFFKMTAMVKAAAGVDHDEMFGHWLDVHVPNVRSTMEQVGGFRYVVSHSMNPDEAPFAGMAEVYFDDHAQWKAYNEAITLDGLEKFIDTGTLMLQSSTEMIGIP